MCSPRRGDGTPRPRGGTRPSIPRLANVREPLHRLTAAHERARPSASASTAGRRPTRGGTFSPAPRFSSYCTCNFTAMSAAGALGANAGVRARPRRAERAPPPSADADASPSAPPARRSLAGARARPSALRGKRRRRRVSTRFPPLAPDASRADPGDATRARASPRRRGRGHGRGPQRQHPPRRLRRRPRRLRHRRARRGGPARRR